MKLATLSLDDGGRGDAVLIPLLAELEIPATFYLCSRFLQSSVYEFHARGDGAAIADLYRSPLVEIGSHGQTHRRLRGLPPDEVRREIKGSREELAAFFGKVPDVYAYPFGDSGGGAAEEAERVGYLFARSVRRENPAEVASPKGRYIMPITGLWPQEAGKIEAAADGLPIHVLAHPWEIVSTGKVHEFRCHLEYLFSAGYKFIFNSDFFRETWKGRAA